MSDFTVYALSHPVTEEVRYIGLSSSGLCRPQQHGSKQNLKKNAHLPVVRWIAKLRNEGVDYVIETIEDFQDRKAAIVGEKYWIAQFRAWGFQLLNCTDGGDGRSGPLSASTIEKMRIYANKPENKLKSSNLLKEFWQDPQYVAKVKAGHERNRLDPLFVPPWEGKKHTPETLAKMSEYQRTHEKTEKQKASIRIMAEVNRGRKHPPRTPEWCAKLGYWKGKEGPRKGWVPNEAERASLAARSQKMWNDPVQKARMVEIRKAQVTDESRKVAGERMVKLFSSDAEREKMSKARGGRRIVDQNGVVYVTPGDAAKKLGLHDSLIKKVLRGKRKATGGYTFKYVEES